MKLATDLKAFLANWRNLLAIGTLGAIGAWVYSRVWMVNPAILGDEYLYSINARKVGPWDPAPVGDFSNYLFNFVYQSTNLCGEAFYACGKILNLFFFLGFIFMIFIVALRFLPFWGAYAFMIASGLSPLSVYTSMFLPESMYFFFIGLLLISVLKAINTFTFANWIVVGVVIGIASLVKPHAWLSAIAVGITLVVVGLTQREIGLKKTILSGSLLVAGAAIGRVVIGVAVGGPKALGFFGQYFGFETIQQVVTGPSTTESAIPTSPVDGVLLIFGPQLNTHLLSVFALMGLAIVGLIVALVDLARYRNLTPVNAFALFSFIWLGSLLLEIVIFTGWVTGLGDDHTLRVLLRYYDFLFVIVPLAGLSVFVAQVQERANVFLRWGLGVLAAVLLTPAFSGYFGTLTIQIADAPNLAGLVVNRDVFNGVALTMFLGVLVFATFPKFTSWTFLAILPLTLIGTGWQIQDQYQGFRGELSNGDKAGQFLSQQFSESYLDTGLILATSRFDGTNVAIWADSAKIIYEVVNPDTVFDRAWVNESTNFIVTLGEISASGEFEQVIQGDGFTIYKIR